MGYNSQLKLDFILLLTGLFLGRAALPPGVVDFSIQSVRLLPDTGGAHTYVFYKDVFGESACQTYAASCYTCLNNSCVPSSWVNASRSIVKAYEPRKASPHPSLGLRREPSFARSRRSFIHQLVRGAGGAIRRLAFSITFPRASDDVGHLTVGGDPDPAWHAPFITLHQRDDQAWTLSIDEVGYRKGSESESIGIEKSRVLFDSGANVIIGPAEEVTSLLNYISKFVEFKGGDVLKVIACSDVDKLPEIWFDVVADDAEGLTTRLFVSGRDYAVAADKPGLCTIDIAGVDLVHIAHYGWILGSPLFRGHFLQFTYDVESIGFAKKRSF
ncbi:hypothetical protein FOZ63_003017 [Perkinsus olseni]|uniref:Peptidase A1 domain-containing protein n=1 Tax=Perkinsus olseni TaxID=32597 RepID=A0A7J6QFA9_PEROL|nr:hypothetical protein FOZ63_003017 [Perkinsus olseni]KAF4721260.1 hypothetical protein FOZ62_028412 [Perkinsus olseni]